MAAKSRAGLASIEATVVRCLMASPAQPSCWRDLIGACNTTRAVRTPSGCTADPRLASAARALGRCANCGLPQRHEACHGLAHEELARRGFGANLTTETARAAVEVSEFERALSELHRAGRCRWPPCPAALPSARGATSGAPLTRLLLGLSAFVPRVSHAARAVRAARVARQAETQPAAVPAGLWEEQRRPELLREWSRLVQQRLQEGWRRAATCHGGGAVRH